MYINMLEYLEATLLKDADHMSVVDGDRAISFDRFCECAKKASRIVARKTNGIIRRPIGVFLEKSIDAVVADTAIVYSGNAYMNLDTKTPAQRISNILELIQPELVITDKKHISTIEAIWDKQKVINLDFIDYDSEEYSQDEINACLSKIIDTDPLCIINTSGSTGVPKGVVLNHRSFIDFTEWAMNTTGIRDHEVIGSLSPIVFDIFSFELCMMMALGSTIVLIPDGLSAFPARILELIQQRHVTFIFWVPTIMVNIANSDLLSRIPLPSLRTVWFAGEVFPTKQFNYWRRWLPSSRFINLYGPIEITLDCTYYIVDRELADDEPIPIGVACRNTDILILNSENRICQINEEGELCVRGTSLAMGYYNNPEKTAAAFVQNPLNKAYPEIIYRTGDIAFTNDKGEIIFKGRKDTMIKHSGYRIELGEVEHVIINSLKLVRNGCAVYNVVKKEIVFYYESDDSPAVTDLKKKTATALPKYMVPTVFIKLDELPRNTNGKIDRLRLKELAQQS